MYVPEILENAPALVLTQLRYCATSIKFEERLSVVPNHRDSSLLMPNSFFEMPEAFQRTSAV